MATKFNNLFPYMGSKIKMLPFLLKDDVLPPKGDILVEPFMGSCALLLNTDYNKYYMNDANKYIYDFAKLLLTINIDEVEEQYNILIDKFFVADKTDKISLDKSKEFFYKVRDLFFNNYDNLSDLKKASMFCFLALNSFSGKPICHNISCGEPGRKKPLRTDIYKAFQAKKEKIILANMDYKDFIKEVLKYENQEDIVLYLDPPYIDSFKYQKDNDVDSFVKDILDYYKNYDFLITIQSNYKHKDITRLYSEYNIIEVDRKLEVQSSKEEEKLIKTEVIVVKDDRYNATREFELKILINWLTDKDYDEKIIKHYKRELKNERK